MLQIESPTYGKVSVDEQGLGDAARLAGYAIINSQLAMLAMLRDTFGLAPAKLLVFLTVATASVQRHVRRTDLPQIVRGCGPMQADDVGMISGRAVAEATGMPRETVRRMLVEMVEEGLLERRPQGRVSVALTLAGPSMPVVLRKLVDEQVRVLERLRQLSVLKVGDSLEPIERH
jgi:hypothetical protein